MSTDKSAAAIREFAEKWGPTFTIEKGQYSDDKLIELCLSDLTALISEHYVSREEYNELLQQRDELREALKQIISIDQNSRLFNSVSITMANIAEAAIKNTDG
jgi:CHASE3 domain sensor protein